MPEFEFVNVARPGDVKRHSTKIRRHVMKDIGKARRKPRAKTRREVVIGESSSPAATDGDTPQTGSSSTTLILPDPRGDSILQTLPYPIDMNEERLSLIRYIVDEAKSRYRPFRFTWLTMGLSDAAAWHITLANAASYRTASKLPPGSTAEYSCSVEAMKWYTLSLASITKRLADPDEKDKEGLIVAITGFICHDATIGNFDRFRIHMEGLQCIINKKGGLETLSSPFLRFMISWLDLIGATYHNIKPRFSIPAGSIRQIDTGNDSQYLEQLLASWDADCPALGDITSAMRATAAVASYINRRPAGDAFWTDDVAIARLLGPAFHAILSLEGRALPADAADPGYSATAAREAFRRAALVFLAAVKVAMGAGAPEMHRHLDAFRQISQLPLVDWGVVPELNLWAHVVSAMQEESPGRAWHVLTIVGIMESMGLRTGGQAVGIARGVIWVDVVDGGKADLLCREIDGYLEASSMLRGMGDGPLPLDHRLGRFSGDVGS
ncbi:hypothetical protein F4813DRAFT_125386 [Daldinia decipiens]|uniref:uncharacterized protein n=1 Tax=Daldinia decipiens TaxID=326647 RepID=UPI0020C252C1|nr:uncharacterized protein F4813DRAFT_125386 [Daldinia decipiens]KAI1656776.1 hypothetical protein F4813DRAFT_125386 [Daldinia decipiens]